MAAFFTPIDVPFLAAMTWTTLAVVVMTRHVLPSWGATVGVGLLSGLAIATRTGGVITHVYLFAALLLCAAEVFAREGRLAPRYLLGLATRYGAAVALVGSSRLTLWPWLQIGNPLSQFKIALVHFATIPTSFEFTHWGEEISTRALPRSYIPAQLLVRLPEVFLVLLALACLHALVAAARLAREAIAKSRAERGAGLRAATLTLARERAMLTVALAVVLPLGFLILQRATMYDGVRHVLFVIPMLALVAGLGWRTLLPLLKRAPIVSAVAVGAYVGGVVATLAALHPLEYVAMNALAGGTRGAYDKFELDYWSAAATEALRRLERRFDYDPVHSLGREPAAHPDLHRHAGGAGAHAAAPAVDRGNGPGQGRFYHCDPAIALRGEQAGGVDRRGQAPRSDVRLDVRAAGGLTRD